jgi:hypothetical protein
MLVLFVVVIVVVVLTMRMPAALSVGLSASTLGAKLEKLFRIHVISGADFVSLHLDRSILENRDIERIYSGHD